MFALKCNENFNNVTFDEIRRWRIIMSHSINTTSMIQNYVCIFKLANRWAPVYVQGLLKTFISNDLELELKVAQAAAKAFAETKNLAFNETVFLLDHPIFTVFKHGSKWYPGELYSDKMNIITKFGHASLEGTKKDAIVFASALSFVTKIDFIPSIGPTINTDELQFTQA